MVFNSEGTHSEPWITPGLLSPLLARAAEQKIMWIDQKSGGRRGKGHETFGTFVIKLLCSLDLARDGSSLFLLRDAF